MCVKRKGQALSDCFLSKKSVSTNATYCFHHDTYTHTYIYLHAHIYMCAHIHTHTHSHTHTNTNIPVGVCLFGSLTNLRFWLPQRNCICWFSQEYEVKTLLCPAHLYLPACTCISQAVSVTKTIHKHSHNYIYIHTHTHTHTHTHL